MPAAVLSCLTLSADGLMSSESYSRLEVLRLAQKASPGGRGRTQARDLRVIDPAFFQTSSEPVILVRDGAALVSLGLVRALLLENRLLVFVGKEERIFEAFKQKSAQMNKSVAFALAAWDILLGCVMSLFDKEAVVWSTVVDGAELTPTDAHLESLRVVRQNISSFGAQCLATQDALNKTLIDADFLARLSLLCKDNSEALAMIFESYMLQMETTSSNCKRVLRDLDALDSTLAIRLDQYRNRLIRLNITLLIITASTSSAGLITGIMGMNLDSGVQAIPGIFWPIAVFTLLTSVAFGYWYLSLLWKSGILIA